MEVYKKELVIVDGFDYCFRFKIKSPQDVHTLIVKVDTFHPDQPYTLEALSPALTDYKYVGEEFGGYPRQLDRFLSIFKPNSSLEDAVAFAIWLIDFQDRHLWLERDEHDGNPCDPWESDLKDQFFIEYQGIPIAMKRVKFVEPEQTNIVHAEVNRVDHYTPQGYVLPKVDTQTYKIQKFVDEIVLFIREKLGNQDGKIKETQTQV